MLLPDTPNFRDFGGHPVTGGGHVRRGHFFRSPALHGLSERDRQVLHGLDPAVILDLRGQEERAKAPNDLGPDLEPRVVSLPVEPSVGPLLRSAADEDRLTGPRAEEIMQSAYRGYAETHFDRFAEALRLICVPRAAPVVFHCSAGKDRTGFLTLLILSGLGVAPDAIRLDFLETNARLVPKPDVLADLPEVARDAVLGVRSSYLDAAIRALTKRGAYPDALTHVLGANAARSFRAWAVAD